MPLGGLPPTVSTHSRLKAAAARPFAADVRIVVSTHSRLKAAAISQFAYWSVSWFQHTAA